MPKPIDFRICSIEGCNERHVAKGLCEKHYKRFLRHGSIENTRSNDWGKREKHPNYGIWAWLRRKDNGLLLCESWRNDFWVFVREVGIKPTKDHVLRRNDLKKLYEPGNVKWEEKLISSNNINDLSPKEIQRLRSAAHRAKNVEYHRKADLKKNYGIGIAEYEEILKSQWGRCAICGKEETMIHPNHNTGKPQRLAVDHCHNTGRIRGLLCSRCNIGIGKLNTPDLLRKAAKYLEERGF